MKSFTIRFVILFVIFDSEVLIHNKPPPSLILKMELFAFLAIFVHYPLVKSIFWEVSYVFRIMYKSFI